MSFHHQLIFFFFCFSFFIQTAWKRRVHGARRRRGCVARHRAPLPRAQRWTVPLITPVFVKLVSKYSKRELKDITSVIKHFFLNQAILVFLIYKTKDTRSLFMVSLRDFRFSMKENN